MSTLVPNDRTVPNDRIVLDLLRKRDRMTVAEFATALGVTATAVRQRLNRLLSSGYIERRKEAASGRGRPSHWYCLTDEGRRNTGSNFADLAIALWDELRAIPDLEVRRGLLQRLAARLADVYRSQIAQGTAGDKMRSVAGLFAERQMPFEVDETGGLPVLTALACPYPDLAERDQSICAMERMMFSELMGERVVLDQCRMNGDACCTFQPATTASVPTTETN